MVKAAALGGLCVYALVGGVADILGGGREVEAGWALAYAVVATVGGGVVALVMRRRSRSGSDLVRAEAAEWIGDALLSLGVLAGFGVSLVLQLTGRADLARFVDPAMVAVISAAFLRVPGRLIVEGFRELLAMSPAAEINDRLRAVVAAVEREHGFAESFLRASKVGRRLDVEIDFVVDDGSTAQTVRQFDDVPVPTWRSGSGRSVWPPRCRWASPPIAGGLSERGPPALGRAVDVTGFSGPERRRG